MRLRAFLAGLLLAGQAHAQIVVRHPAFAVVQSTAPALDLNFLTTTLDSRVTFSRASTRSCTNSSGQIVSVAVNVACMDYDPGTLALKGLSVEAAGTNLLYASQNWLSTVAASGSVDGQTQSAGTAPDGTTTAMKLIPGSFSNTHQWYRVWTGAVSTPYVHSVFVKAAGMNYVTISLENSAFSPAQVLSVNLSNGTITSNSANGSGTIQAFPGGWYRIAVQATSAATTGNYVVNILPNASSGNPQPTTGDAVSGVLVWGQQVETGYAATSYIPTTSAAVTRAADVAYVNVVGLQGINGNTGSLFGQMVYEAPYTTLGYSAFLAFLDGTAPNNATTVGFYNTFASANAVTINASVSLAGTGSVANIASPTWSYGQSGRFAMAFNANILNAAFTVNGTTGTATLANSQTTTPRTLTELIFNQPAHYQGQASLWFQRVTYYPSYLGPNWVTNKASGAIP